MESSERETQQIVDYLADQARDETIEQLEKVASESVYGHRHDVWDVHTNKERWWIITNPTNLYSQQQFPSMDSAISFHIGLMARVISRSAYAIPEEESQRFANAWRRWQQAGKAFEDADEAEEFQAVGMRCRESLIAFVEETAKIATLPESVAAPKASDYVNWSSLIADTIAPGASADRRRGYLKATAKATWELVNWLTHASNATRLDAQFALDATGYTLSSFALSTMRFERGVPERCPQCGSYKIVTDHPHSEADEKLEVTLCTVCGWEDATEVLREEPQNNDVQQPTNENEDIGPCIVVEAPLRGPKPPKPSERNR
jgi:hypothetical protein